MNNFNLHHCTVCPRECGDDRTVSPGFCGEGAQMRVSKIMLHRWEEPCISGKNSDRGSGAIFFSGCPLKCVFCQNGEISRGGAGNICTPEELSAEIRRLEAGGAYNINFVSPTHFIPQIIDTLKLYRPAVPTVFNTGGYEKADTVSALGGFADVFLTDFKYASPELSEKYSGAPDYAERAARALLKMVEITGVPVYDKDGMLRRGVIVRHLVLPGGRRDSVNVLRMIADTIPASSVILSLMSQYTPDFAPKSFPELSRRITTFEYESVRDEALRLGFSGFSQDVSSAKKSYTPDFQS